MPGRRWFYAKRPRSQAACGGPNLGPPNRLGAQSSSLPFTLRAGLDESRKAIVCRGIFTRILLVSNLRFVLAAVLPYTLQRVN